ncbi:uncharacterized protein LOC111392953 [Olea europaea var. sylvestris]|uniref:uncharacterized protein LOC111392953 n=1 Tax=Olea europaea var. sylvestris TaxID=158386 RepID=UPI000C1D3D88|nr:uncharacterized protein LOC111392953 [Olea europaea var. sylvestris]
MGISPKPLKAVKTHLQGFGGGVIIPEGIVELPLTLGSDNAQVTEITPFQVVNTPMAYNIILGRPLLNKIQAIVSTFHLAMKFPTGHGIGVVREDQTAARQCYVTSIQGMSTDVMQLSDLELELEPRGRLAPVEELEVVELEHRKMVTIGRDLKASLREEIINYLFRNIDVFAWKKATDKWRVCIDFIDLNKACSKDSYPLTRIDNFVDSTEMPFGLKNAEAIYQRLINKVFTDLIGKNIEAYVDDLVVKSKKVE